MNKQPNAGRNENTDRIDKNLSGENTNEKQVSNNNSVNSEPPSAEREPKTTVMPMHEEDTLGNP